MSDTLTEVGANVLRALQEGRALTRHDRAGRGPYYTLGGRRLSMPLVKQLEAQRFIARSGRPGSPVSAYELTPAGTDALTMWTTRP
ncbi:hypothetical protein LAJ19_11015 [Deinococcus taeanensis]|uniref:hypothetical protein n=1 Tax=Deinococcus taeanensis TaxID=2737050 RepID=UPI001CDB8A14|nr:hypothetical protein [Deinococcus taeanensis]UBV42155.1 hypothetical protein LAJ19_11015 [Deinococcus taeanensis]